MFKPYTGDVFDNKSLKQYLESINQLIAALRERWEIQDVRLQNEQ